MHYTASIEPFSLLSALAPLTKNIALVCTATTSYENRYATARDLVAAS